MIPVEIGSPSLRSENYDQMLNQAETVQYLALVDVEMEEALIKMAAYK